MEISHRITECETVLISDYLESSSLFCCTKSLGGNLGFRSHTQLLLCRLECITSQMWGSQNQWSWKLLSKVQVSNPSRNLKPCTGLLSLKQFFLSKDSWYFCNNWIRKSMLLLSYSSPTFLLIFPLLPFHNYRPVTAFTLILFPVLLPKDVTLLLLVSQWLCWWQLVNSQSGNMMQRS